MERRDATLLSQRVNTSSSGTSGKERRLTFISFHLLRTYKLLNQHQISALTSYVLQQVLILQGQKHEVTYLCPSPDGIHIAVGYEDGGVRIFSLLNGESNVSFNGHKSAVSVIHYDGLGARLVTGSRVRFGTRCAWRVLPLIEHINHNDCTPFFRIFPSLQDTDVIVWDIINECGLYRLKGHKDIVTQALFLQDKNLLVTRCCTFELITDLKFSKT